MTRICDGLIEATPLEPVELLTADIDPSFLPSLQTFSIIYKGRDACMLEKFKMKRGMHTTSHSSLGVHITKISSCTFELATFSVKLVR